MAGGRPTLLTAELIAETLRLSKTCAFAETIAPALGIGKVTMYDWLKRGRKESRRRERGLQPRAAEDLHVLFAEAFSRGRAEAEIAHLELIRAAAQAGAWQAAAWTLERSRPERWSNHVHQIRVLTEQVSELQKKLDPERRKFDSEKSS